MTAKLRSLVLNAALAAALLGGAIAVASQTSLIVGDGAPRASNASERQGADVRIRGNVRGLYPGASKKMKIRVRNRYPIGVKVVKVRGKVKRAGPGCGRRYVRVKRFRRTRWIRAKSRIKVRTRVKMRPNSPDACQGARFPVRFRARFKRRSAP